MKVTHLYRDIEKMIRKEMGCKDHDKYHKLVARQVLYENGHDY